MKSKKAFLGNILLTLCLFIMSFTSTSCQNPKKNTLKFNTQLFIGHWIEKPSEASLTETPFQSDLESKNEAHTEANSNKAPLKVFTIKSDLAVVGYILNEPHFESNIPPELATEENYMVDLTQTENNPFLLTRKKMDSLKLEGKTDEQIREAMQNANLMSLSANSDGTLTKKTILTGKGSPSKTLTEIYRRANPAELEAAKQSILQVGLENYLLRAPLLDLIVGRKFELMEAVSQKMVDGKGVESVTKASQIHDEKPTLKNDKVYVKVIVKSVDFNGPKNNVLINNRYPGQFFISMDSDRTPILQFLHESDKIINATLGKVKESPEGIDIINVEMGETTIWKFKREIK